LPARRSTPPSAYDDQGTYAIAADCTGLAFLENDDEPFKLIFVDSKAIVSMAVPADAPADRDRDAAEA